MPRRRKTTLDSFHDATQSLKRYQRAELRSETGENLIATLYEDPLPNNHVLNVMLRPNTTFLIGRKGSGKSTVFQRTQHELRSKKAFRTYLSAYLDIKTVYESSEIDQGLLEEIKASAATISEDALKRLLRFKAFVGDLIGGIIADLRPTLRNRKLFRELESLLEEAKAGDNFVRILGVRQIEVKKRSAMSTKTTRKLAGRVDLAGAGADAELGREAIIGDDEELNYREILMLDYNIKSYMLKLKALLTTIGVRHLFVFVDDFSELPLDAMKIVVDTILAPLNNWSEELIKFKVACYPGRIYLGEIDKSKVDELTLDIDHLYGMTDIAKVEAGGTDFVRRLISTRLKYFCKTDLQAFLPPRKQDIWRLLFLASSGNPRILGTLLFYVYETELIHSRHISPEAVENAAQRYYEEKIEADFSLRRRFLQVSFEERSSFYALKHLLDNLISEALSAPIENVAASRRNVMQASASSHFCVATEWEMLLETLELNFFLTRYQNTLTIAGKKVLVFSLNYGLCRKHHITFGRGNEESRYYLTPRYDYTRLLIDHMGSSQEIKCAACGAVFPPEQLDALRLFDMACPACKKGTCQVRSLARIYARELAEADRTAQLPETELGILLTLAASHTGLRPKEIAAELDCSYQLVARRGIQLKQRGLVDHSRGQPLKITQHARDVYF
jgi:hypothetical protein